MKASFVDYYKTILEKVSFDKNLFIKEYNKAMRTLESSELDELNQWLESSELYKDLEMKGIPVYI